MPPYRVIKYSERAGNFGTTSISEIFSALPENYIFHGSPVKELEGGVLKPGKRGICATNCYRVAVFKALVRHVGGNLDYNLHSKEAPFYARFHILSDEEIGRYGLSGSDRIELRINASGYVYVLGSEEFEQGFYPLEFRAYKPVKPIFALEVIPADLKEFLDEIHITNPDEKEYRIITPKVTFVERSRVKVLRVEEVV